MRPQYYFVSNSLVVSHSEMPLYPESIEDRCNHGTAVAALAGGKTYGIAPKSGLYMMKYGADMDMGRDGVGHLTSPAALYDVTGRTISNIRANPGRKAVVNMSSGEYDLLKDKS